MFPAIRLIWTRFCAWCRTKIIKIFDGWAEDNCFRLLDMVLLFAGIPSPSTSGWTHERLIRYSSTCLYAYQTTIWVLAAHSVLSGDRDNTFEVAWVLVRLIGILMIGVKTLSVVLLQESIASLRQFVTASDRIGSGDSDFDERQQHGLKHSVKTLVQFVFGLFLVDTVLLSIPNSTTKAAFALPPELSRTGELSSRVLYFLMVNLLPLGGVPRLLSSLTSVGVLLMGMRTKLKMVTHRYERMLDEPFVDVDHYFKHMNKEVREALDQQLEFWGHLQTLKAVVGKTFWVVHYYAIGCIGVLCYISKDIGIDVFSFVVVAAVSGLLLEYYLWCWWVDAFKDESDRIGLLIYEVCAKMPHNQQHHTDHVQLRTSLIITWINTRNGMSMDCLGLFEISTKAFLGLLNVAYKVMTFFINMG